MLERIDQREKGEEGAFWRRLQLVDYVVYIYRAFHKGGDCEGVGKKSRKRNISL
jgi:hypothetical protein